MGSHRNAGDQALFAASRGSLRKLLAAAIKHGRTDEARELKRELRDEELEARETWPGYRLTPWLHENAAKEQSGG